MNNNKNSRSGFIKLYNPQKEGLGAYDINYINAYKKSKYIKNQLNQKKIDWRAA